MGKEACVVVFDVGHSMTKSGFEHGIQTLQLMVHQKLLFPSQDVMGVVLVGTKDTENQLNTEAGEGYEHVSVFRLLAKSDMDFLSSIDEIEPSVDAEGDIIDGLLVAMGMINDFVGRLKYEKRIFIITDGGGRIVDDRDAFVRVCDSIVAMNYKVNIFGLGFTDEDDSDDDSDDNNNDDDSNKNNSSQKKLNKSITTERTSIQLANEKLLKDMVTRVNGTIHSIQSALEIFSQFASKHVNPTTKLRADFEISDKIKIPIYTYAKTSMAKLPTLKSESRLGTDSKKVEIDRSYISKNVSEDIIVTAEERVRAYRYGKQLQTMTSVDESVLQYECIKCMKLIGFCSKTKIPRHAYMSNTDIVVPQPGNDTAAEKLSAFVHACYETGRVCLVRYVTRKNSQPHLAVMSPHIDESLECFFLNILPFQEDVRHYSFASLDDRYPVSKEELNITRQLVHDMNLAEFDDGEVISETVEPESTFNPILQRFYQTIKSRALDPQCELPPLDPVIQKYLNPDKQIMKIASDSLKKFEQTFPLKVVEKPTNGIKRRWREFLEPESESKNVFKRIHNEITDTSFEAMIDSGLIEHISLSNPIGDFNKMITRRDDSKYVLLGITQMLEIINEIIERGMGDSGFPKAISCVRTLRQACIQEQEVKPFNDGMEIFKQKQDDKGMRFFKYLKEENIYPISQLESQTSTYTDNMIKTFFGDNETIVENTPTSVVMEDDDVFDDLD